jgi:hypothetical protein
MHSFEDSIQFCRDNNHKIDHAFWHSLATSARHFYVTTIRYCVYAFDSFYTGRQTIIIIMINALQAAKFNSAFQAQCCNLRAGLHGVHISEVGGMRQPQIWIYCKVAPQVP